MESHPIFDSPERWAEPGIFKPPLFEVPSFQKRLNKIVGLSPSGHPIVRLIWLWNARKWENTEWNDFGNATNGEFRQKYRALTVEIGNGDYVDIAPPRWGLEERYEPASIATSWEATRYRRVVTETPPFMCRYCHAFKWISVDQSEGHLLMCRFCQNLTELRTVNQDVWGEVPREGWYTMLPNRGMGVIAHHRNNCCAKAKELGEICWGFYKEPDNLELKRLAKAVQQRNKDMETNPHIKPELNEAALQQAKFWGLQMMQDAKVAERGQLAEIRKAHRFNNNIVYST